MRAPESPPLWALFAMHLFMTALVASAGWGLWRGVGRGSAARRTHGAFVLGWAAAGYAIGWPAGLLAGADLSGLPGGAGFGLLAGWLVGTLHGAAVLARRRWWPHPD